MSAEARSPRIPDTARYLLAGAQVPGSLLDVRWKAPSHALCAVDLLIADGRIERISPAGSLPAPGIPAVDVAGATVLPCPVDAHTHLDKGHIWPRAPNPDGTFDAALAAVAADCEARWSAADVRSRMDFSLRCAFAHGTRAVRTHIDSIPPQDTISWPVFSELRAAWAGRIDLQGVCLVGIEHFRDQALLDRLADQVAEHGGVLGAVTYMVPDLAAILVRVFDAAAARGLDLDFHADESGDASAGSLRVIAETALARDFSGRVVAGHCCSLAIQDSADAERTMAVVAEAGIGVISLPMCNLYLQDRAPGRTPRWRGVTLVHELRARGVDVAFASDNTRDPFYAYGDLDLIEVFREAVRIAHLDHPLDGWIDTVTTAPARLLGLDEDGRVRPGAVADLVLLEGRSFNEVLARPGAGRLVMRSGREIAAALPHYCELHPTAD